MVPLPASVLITVSRMESRRARERRGLSPVKTEYDDSAIADHADELAEVIGISVRHLQRILKKLEAAKMVSLVVFEVSGKRGRPELEVRPTQLGLEVSRLINILNAHIIEMLFGEGPIHEAAMDAFDEKADEHAREVKNTMVFNQVITDQAAKKLIKIVSNSKLRSEQVVDDLKPTGRTTIRIPVLDRDYDCPNKRCPQCSKYGNARRLIVIRQPEDLQLIGIFCFFGGLKSDLRINPKLFYARQFNQMLIDQGAGDKGRQMILEALGMKKAIDLPEEAPMNAQETRPDL